MNLIATVLAKDPGSETSWAAALKAATKGMLELDVRTASSGGEQGQVVFVDEKVSDLGRVLDSMDRRGKAVFLMVKEDSGVPPALAQGKVDDVLVFPFRPLEVLGKLRHYQQILLWSEVTALNDSFAELIDRLHDDLRLAERLQKSKLPHRFPEIRGMKVASRYLAGMKSGGDHLDLAESKDGTKLSLFLSDSSSYGLSSAVLSVLMTVAMKLTSDEIVSASETVRKIQTELMATLGERDRLSLFYGALSRKDYKLRYLNLGTSLAYYAPPGKDFEALKNHGEAITKKTGPIGALDSEVTLETEGRLVLLSDGFVDVAGGKASAEKLLDRFRDREAADLANELAYQVKSKFTEPDDLPEQDCTVAVFDVDTKVVRLGQRKT